jgi:hypothetical protein
MAFVYCDSEDREKQTAANLISSLTRQLLEPCTDIPAEVRELYNSCLREKRSPTLTEHEMLLQSVLHISRRTFIIIDALDELPHQHKDSFRSVIEQLAPSARFLITARPDEHVFEGASRVKIEAIKSDVKAYLEFEMENDQQFAARLSEDLQADIIDTVYEQSTGMYVGTPITSSYAY